MAQSYSIEFKEEACKRVQSGVPAAQLARKVKRNSARILDKVAGMD